MTPRGDYHRVGCVKIPDVFAWRLKRVGWPSAVGVRIGLLLLSGLLVGGARAQEEEEVYGPQPQGGPIAQAQYETNRQAFGQDADKLVLPGLVADRARRRVDLLAECTGLGERETIEFLLIDQGSSHGYEAMLWSLAKPSHVEQALEFIGLRRGTPIHPAVPRLWSDGDRAQLTVKLADGVSFPIEQLILDLETGKTLPEEGFVFAGSIVVPSPDGTRPPIYAADTFDPRSVASIYNEPASVLDVPRRVDKGEAYGRQVVNPDHVLAGGTLVTVEITPAQVPGQPRAVTWRLQADPGSEPSGMRLRLTGDDGALAVESGDLLAVIEKVVPEKPVQEPPFVQVSFGEDLHLSQVQKTAALLAGLESLGAVRVRPPARDQLFHRAFIPKPEWREPTGRPSQPWELHLTHADGALSAALVRQEPAWEDGRTEPTFAPQTDRLSSPEDLQARLAADTERRIQAGEPRMPEVLFVFADPDITYGEMMRYVRPVQITHGTVYVFVAPEETSTAP